MTFTQKQKIEILERDQYRCRAFWIAPDIPCAAALQVDHIIPLGRGGRDEIANGWALCAYCHKLKHEYPEAATYLGLYGRETFARQHDQIDPETFGNYLALLKQKKALMSRPSYPTGTTTW